MFEESCVKAAKICVIMFVPHILDSKARGRNVLLETIQDVAKGFRGKPISFVWSEGTFQPELENALDVNFVYPTVSVISAEKKVYKKEWGLVRKSANKK